MSDGIGCVGVCKYDLLTCDVENLIRCHKHTVHILNCYVYAISGFIVGYALCRALNLGDIIEICANLVKVERLREGYFTVRAVCTRDLSYRVAVCIDHLRSLIGGDHEGELACRKISACECLVYIKRESRVCGIVCVGELENNRCCIRCFCRNTKSRINICNEISLGARACFLDLDCYILCFG